MTGGAGSSQGKPYLCVEQQFQMWLQAVIGTPGPGAHQTNFVMDQLRVAQLLRVAF